MPTVASTPCPAVITRLLAHNLASAYPGSRFSTSSSWMGTPAPWTPWTTNWMAAVMANSSRMVPPARVSPAASRARARDLRPFLLLVRMGQVLYT